MTSVRSSPAGVVASKPRGDGSYVRRCLNSRRRRCRFTSASAAVSSSSSSSPDVLAFTFIVDDLVWYDGRTSMARTGGGGPQTLWGARYCNAGAHLALAAGVGEDMPEECGSWLAELSVDIEALKVVPSMPTPRAWQITEEDGRRTQVWRTQHGDAQAEMLRPNVAAIPKRMLSAKVAHVGIHPNFPPYNLLNALSESGALVSVEPFTEATTPLTDTELKRLCQSVSILSPNLLEARSMLGDEGVHASTAAAKFLHYGARMATVRCGADGAIVLGGINGGSGSDAQDNPVHVPAFSKTDVLDVTGCGNAMCGGVAASLARGNSAVDALAWGAAAASEMAESIGVPKPPPSSLRPSPTLTSTTTPAGDEVDFAERANARFQDVRSRCRVEKI